MGRHRRLLAAGIYRLRRAHRLPGAAHVLEQLPQGPSAQRGIHRRGQLRGPRPGRALLARGAQYLHLGVHLAPGGGDDRAAPRARPLRPRTGHAFLSHCLVHAGAHVLRRRRDHLGLDLQLRLGRRERAASPPRVGSVRTSLDRRCPRSSSSPPGCGPASTWWSFSPRCTPSPRK